MSVGIIHLKDQMRRKPVATQERWGKKDYFIPGWAVSANMELQWRRNSTTNVTCGGEYSAAVPGDEDKKG